MSNPQKLNYIVLSDGSFYRVFERLGKNVPFAQQPPRSSWTVHPLPSGYSAGQYKTR